MLFVFPRLEIASYRLTKHRLDYENRILYFTFNLLKNAKDSIELIPQQFKEPYS